MEEEGIFYFFKHTKAGHKMVVANAPRVHENVPGASTVQWDTVAGSGRAQRHIHDWVKLQDIRSGKYALWDQHFERPNDNFETKKSTLATVNVGTVAHKLQVAGNEQFEIYEYPGEFAQRFDGIDSGGGEQSASLGKISPDGTRTAELRMQAETVAGLVIQGSSNCNQFVSGHKFTLEKHFDAAGSYVLTSVHHAARDGSAFRSTQEEDFVYSNTFTCIPEALPFRPQRSTPKPVIHGAQTAIVVGPSGVEIFTDKYGRVKVQFPWDRESKADANSSCWLRVGTPWAGKKWGSIHIPRIGHEVIVQFLEGDPDAPIIVGSVYNASAMPPYTLPDEKTKSTLKSNSSTGGGGFNEIRFEDKKGKEQIFVHAEKQRDLRVKENNLEYIGNEEHLIVVKDRFKKIKGDEHTEIVGCRNEKVGESESLKVGQNLLQKVGMNAALEAGADIHIKGGTNVVIEAGVSLTIKVGGNFVNINPGGVFITGTMVMINSGGAAGTGGGCSPTPPKEVKEADTGEPGSKDAPPPARTAGPQVTYSPTAVALQAAAQSGAPFVAVCPTQ
jgi:type VI secretion system secreted protein VgrG